MVGRLPTMSDKVSYKAERPAINSVFIKTGDYGETRSLNLETLCSG